MSWCVCHARSMSSVGTKNEPGASAMSPKKLERMVENVRHMENHNVRMVSCNTVLQDDHLLFFSEEGGICPTEINHLAHECTLSQDLEDPLGLSGYDSENVLRRTAPTRSTEKGRSSTYALEIRLPLLKMLESYCDRSSPRHTFCVEFVRLESWTVMRGLNSVSA